MRKKKSEYGKLAQMRIAAGYTQEQVARMIHHGRTTIAHWERREKVPHDPYEKAKTLSRIYGVHYQDILNFFYKVA